MEETGHLRCRVYGIGQSSSLNDRLSEFFDAGQDKVDAGKKLLAVVVLG
jgi:hypothetical protein